MFETILVPLDGSRLAERAIPHAERLAQACGAGLVLLRAETAGIGASRVAVVQGALAYLEAIATELRGRGRAVRTTVPYGDPATSVVEEAHRGKADLIVLASHARAGLAHLIYGSVAEEILARAPIPAFLVEVRPDGPDDKPSARWDRLLVPLDGSPFAEVALGPARDLARALGSEVLLVRAFGHPETYPVTLSELAQPYLIDGTGGSRAGSLAYLDAVAAHHLGEILTTRIIREGEPAAVIASTCRDYQAGLVVMASHGRQGAGRFFLGNVAGAAQRLASIPFLLIGPGAGAGLADEPMTLPIVPGI